jgi:hypothetical protein
MPDYRRAHVSDHQPGKRDYANDEEALHENRQHVPGAHEPGVEERQPGRVMNRTSNGDVSIHAVFAMLSAGGPAAPAIGAWISNETSSAFLSLSVVTDPSP